MEQKRSLEIDNYNDLDEFKLKKSLDSHIFKKKKKKSLDVDDLKRKYLVKKKYTKYSKSK